MIFNRDNEGAVEIRFFTGNYSATNEFEKLIPFVESATEKVIAVIGKNLYDKVDKDYNNYEDSILIDKVQKPIAILSTLELYKNNDLTHDNDGRKVTLSDKEKIPWEWQLDRDNNQHLERYYEAMESLLIYLNDSDIQEWKDSANCKYRNSLIIRSGKEFENYYPIDSSERLFILLQPFIKEIQMRFISPAYGNMWNELLNEDISLQSNAHYAACKATALLSISTALKRMPLQLFPCGVIKNYIVDNGISTSSPASMEDIKEASQWLEMDAKDWIEQMKIYRDNNKTDMSLLPNNDKNNKYCIL